jgi:Predicted ATPase related to phosphate starvation-inducible protein PhoH
MAKTKSKRPQDSFYQSAREVVAQTENQKDYLSSLFQQKDVVVHGCAGTGKGYLTLYYALKCLQERVINRILIIRSAVPTRDLGFLPGTEEEKLSAYEAPYRELINELVGRGDAYDILKKKEELVFLSSSYLRGLTFDNTFILVDEVQNMTFHEIDTIYTRVGENCQVAFTGDFVQLDEGVGKQGSGIQRLITVARNLPSFDVHEFTIDDIIRSQKVKDWIIETQVRSF